MWSTYDGGRTPGFVCEMGVGRGWERMERRADWESRWRDLNGSRGIGGERGHTTPVLGLSTELVPGVLVGTTSWLIWTYDCSQGSPMSTCSSSVVAYTVIVDETAFTDDLCFLFPCRRCCWGVHGGLGRRWDGVDPAPWFPVHGWVGSDPRMWAVVVEPEDWLQEPVVAVGSVASADAVWPFAVSPPVLCRPDEEHTPSTAIPLARRRPQRQSRLHGTNESNRRRR